MRILFADDSRTMRQGLGEQMRAMGHEIVEAHDGRVALELFNKVEPDLVVLDVDMPVMNGYETARQIRAVQGHEWIPIIFLSGNVLDSDVAAGIDAGGDDYLAKPVSAVVLRAKISAMQRITDMRARLVELTREMARINEGLREESTQDALTGIPNRRSFDTAFNQEWNHAVRAGKPLALIIADVDHFKLFNDTYGHQKGDECLRAVAAAMRTAARRKVDMVARYGGEEFAMLLPDTPAVSALLVAGRVLEAVRGARLPHQSSSTSDHVTMSLGVCATMPCAELKPEALVNAADRALYDAKSRGRNQAVLRALQQD
ncbi:MAG TPA: diguanylate cyclase [Verrucomicrobiae bacterium]|nr:diguanylate cyclase [Verrucomicrobiae bacterium]